MKKSLFIISTAFFLLFAAAACQHPDYNYPLPKDYAPELPDLSIQDYSITVFSSNLTDPLHPSFGVSANRENFGSAWVTRQCTFEVSSPDITIKAYEGSIEVLKSCAMVVTASVSGTITVTYPTPIGEKTSSTINVVYMKDEVAGTETVALVPAG